MSPRPVWTGAINPTVTGIRSPDLPARSLWMKNETQIQVTLGRGVEVVWEESEPVTLLLWGGYRVRIVGLS
jgi:hypothetical protein